MSLLAFLGERGSGLGSCTQSDVDIFLTSGPSAHCIADFAGWAMEGKLMGPVTVPSHRNHEGPALNDETRWSIVRRLLHDDEIELGDRVAGCLVALYGQQTSRIVTLRHEQVSMHDGTTRLTIGATYIEIPEPLATLLNRLCQSRRPKTGVVAVPTPWLFPGLYPGRPLNPSHLAARLRNLGLPVMATRRSALTHLGSQLPAAVIADLLGTKRQPCIGCRRVEATGTPTPPGSSDKLIAKHDE